MREAQPHLAFGDAIDELKEKVSLIYTVISMCRDITQKFNQGHLNQFITASKVRSEIVTRWYSLAQAIIGLNENFEEVHEILLANDEYSLAQDMKKT